MQANFTFVLVKKVPKWKSTSPNQSSLWQEGASSQQKGLPSYSEVSEQVLNHQLWLKAGLRSYKIHLVALWPSMLDTVVLAPPSALITESGFSEWLQVRGHLEDPTLCPNTFPLVWTRTYGCDVLAGGLHPSCSTHSLSLHQTFSAQYV